MVANFVLTLLAMVAAFIVCAGIAGFVMDKYVVKKDTSDPQGAAWMVIIVCFIAGCGGVAAVAIF